MSGTVLRICHMLSHLNVTRSLWDRLSSSFYGWQSWGLEGQYLLRGWGDSEKWDREAGFSNKAYKTTSTTVEFGSTPFSLYPGILTSKSEQNSSVHPFLPPNTITSLRGPGSRVYSLTPTAKGLDTPYASKLSLGFFSNEQISPQSWAGLVIL